MHLSKEILEITYKVKISYNSFQKNWLNPPL